MIFIPEKNVSKNINEYDSDFLFWEYDKDFKIMFEWGRTPEYNEKSEEISYIKNYDPFYLRVLMINQEEMMQCPLNACKAYPQLRYNKIIDKWYCNCPSSALCTKNDDQDELDNLLKGIKEFDEEHGFYSNPIEAIIKWNLSTCEDIKETNEMFLKRLKGEKE